MNDVIRRLREKHRDDEGFTLIELLVVVVIIGVLVAIAVPVYLSYREGAADKSAQSDVRGAISAVEQFYTENNNTYPATATNVNGAVLSPQIVLGAAPQSTQTVNLSDRTRLGYNRTVADGGKTYTICANNTGGSGAWYVYKSAAGGSVKKSTVSAPSLTDC